MAIELIAKIKPKNGGTFKMVDAVDVEMADGSDLQSTVNNLKNTTSTGGFSIEVNGEKSTDYDLAIDFDEVNKNYGSLYENMYKQFVSMITSLQEVVDKQQTRINELEERVFALEQGKVNPVDPPVTNTSIALVDYNGNYLVDYNGNKLVTYEQATTEEIQHVILVDYNGNKLIDYDNNCLVTYEKIQAEETEGLVKLADYNGNVLIDYAGNYLVTYETNSEYLVDYNDNYLVDYNGNKLKNY